MLKRCVVLALTLFATYLAGPAQAQTCDAQCASYARGVVHAYVEAVQQYQANVWFGTVWFNTPHSQCVIRHESINAGLWSAYDGSGNYGAYQFDQGTWDSASRSRGRTDLVGVRPDEAVWYEQVFNYATTFVSRGDQPWGGRCL